MRRSREYEEPSVGEYRARRSELLYYADRARRGDPCSDERGLCRGCGLPVDQIAEGATRPTFCGPDGCPVCIGYLEYLEGDAR